MDPQTITILVIDDDEFIQTLLNETLSAEGYSVIQAGSSEETYSILEKMTPDLIVMDIILPDQNGFELCKDLRTRDSLASIPILMLSSKYTVSDRVRGLTMGADDYLVKPFHLEELNARVKALYRRTEIHKNQLTDIRTSEVPPGKIPIPPLEDVALIEEPEEEPELIEIQEPPRTKPSKPVEVKVPKKPVPVSKPVEQDGFEGRRTLALEHFQSNRLEDAFKTFKKLNQENPRDLEVKKYVEITRNLMMKKYLGELVSKDSVPVRTSDRPEDFIGLDFNTGEGFIFSRIDGITDCKGIVAISGMSTLKAYGILYNFSQSGVIKFKRK